MSAIDSDQLLRLARSRSPADRERLMLALADVCHDEAQASSPAVQLLLRDVFMSLVVEAERDIRRRLAERLADAGWAPRPLVTVLAMDDIEIARPLIAGSPVLQDHDLVRLLVEATIEHQIEVARRPRLGQRVVSAILDQADPAVLSALAGNDSAAVSPLAMSRMVEASRRVAAMRAPLARHPAMTDTLACRMYLWVGEALREALVGRFQVDRQALETEIAAAVDEVSEATPREISERPLVRHDSDREEMERRVIAKLAAAGQLKPGYLLPALKERRLSLFEHALAQLAGLPVHDLRRAIGSDQPELLALACVAVGIDKSVFPTILHDLRALTGGSPRNRLESAAKVEAAFRLSDGERARAALREAAAGDLTPAV